jgi:hypothetical protein
MRKLRRTEEQDQQVVQEMWTLANNEPLTVAPLVPFGFVDRERYRRYLGDVNLELTLDKDPQTGIWSYELAILNPESGPVDPEVVEYWLKLFFGREAHFAAKRNFMLTDESRFTFPYKR